MPANHRANFERKCREVSGEVAAARAEDRILVYLDEICFTKATIPLREWSSHNSNLAIDQRDLGGSFRTVIACISEARGMDLRTGYNAAINAEDFIAFLKKLRARFQQVPIALYMDQLNVHRAIAVKPWYDELNIKPILNVAYSPEFNPIEAIFSKVKSHFKRERLNCMVNKKGFNVDRTINAAFNVITPEHCNRCIRKSEHLLRRAAGLE